MSAAGVAKYITDVVSQDLSQATIFGGARRDDIPKETPDQQKARIQAEFNVEVKRLEAEIQAKTEKLNQMKQTAQTTASQIKSNPSAARTATSGIPTAESHNFSSALWKQVRENK